MSKLFLLDRLPHELLTCRRDRWVFVLCRRPAGARRVLGAVQSRVLVEAGRPPADLLGSDSSLVPRRLLGREHHCTNLPANALPLLVRHRQVAAGGRGRLFGLPVGGDDGLLVMLYLESVSEEPLSRSAIL